MYTWCLPAHEDDTISFAACFERSPGVHAHTVVAFKTRESDTWTDRMTPLAFVLRYHMRKRLAWLLAAAPPVLCFTLHEAAEHGWYDGVDAMLAHGGVDINSDGPDTTLTALEALCDEMIKRPRHLNMIRYLVWRGAAPGRFQEPIVDSLFDRRDRCRASVLALLASHHYKRSGAFGGNDVHVVRLVARMLWASRQNEEWDAK